MKKIVAISIGLIGLTLIVGACRKGENDPLLSLKSRQARLAGEWVVSSSEVQST
jgi:hypothetical protein